MNFNVRAYGLLIHPNTGAWLIAHENMDGFAFTKFPGGGVQFGEGPEDAVIREFKEECEFEVKIKQHIYTTGFYQPSAFRPDDQIISIYYRMENVKNSWVLPPLRKVNLDASLNHWLVCEWVLPGNIKEDTFTFPIDRYVFRLLQNGQ